MDFKLTDEQKQYKELAAEFAANEIFPKAEHFDQTGAFPEELIRQAFELGLMNLNVPETYGGLGLNIADACLIVEELAAACPAIALSMTANSVASAPVICAFSDEQKQAFLEPLTTDLSFAAFCVDPLAITHGKSSGFTFKKQNGGFVISGSRAMVANASRAKWFFVLASDEDGMSTAFIVPHGDQIMVSDRIDCLGLRAQDFRNVEFKNVQVSASNAIGAAGDGLNVTRKGFLSVLPLIASLSIGAARAAMHHAINYSKERTTFGVAISNHQAVGFMIADMAKDIEAARLLTKQAAHLADGSQAELARTFANQMAIKAATDAVQVFGGYGYSREYPVEKLMRDCKVLQIYESIGANSVAHVGLQAATA